MIDETDEAILEILQRRARTKRGELASATGLSTPAISERMKKLEDAGIVRAYLTAVDYRALGYDVSAFIAVTVDSSKHYRTFLGRVESEDEVLECHAVTGKGTHLLKVRTRNTAALERLLSRIQSWEGVSQTVTNLVLSSPKETTYVPLSNKGPKRP
ncbi:MAG TPA: Lrp/AsnC family transcriptional regulator [bacterium]|nr:Lrp/AsnC family transcriptional regulator [bacterium]